MWWPLDILFPAGEAQVGSSVDTPAGTPVVSAVKALADEVRAEQDAVTVLADRLIALLDRVNFAPETMFPPVEDPLEGCDPEIVILVAYKLAGRLARVHHRVPDVAEAAR